MGVRGVGETLMIAGGGTGGHIYPAIAIAQEWMARDATRRVIFVGTERGLEKTDRAESRLPTRIHLGCGLKAKASATPQRSFRLPSGFRGRPSNSPAGTVQTSFLGVGGYSSGPVLLAAKLRGVRR